MFFQDVSGQKLTYAQIIQKKKEKEAKEAAERAAKEAAEGNHSEQSGKGKRKHLIPLKLIDVNGSHVFRENRGKSQCCVCTPLRV